MISAETVRYIASIDREISALREENARLRAALEIIAGKRQCLDNLMSNVDVAHAVLAEVKPGSACADRAETVEQTHARWSAPKKVKPEPFSDAACGPRYSVKSEHG